MIFFLFHKIKHTVYFNKAQEIVVFINKLNIMQFILIGLKIFSVQINKWQMNLAMHSFSKNDGGQALSDHMFLQFIFSQRDFAILLYIHTKYPPPLTHTHTHNKSSCNQFRCPFLSPIKNKLNTQVYNVLLVDYFVRKYFTSKMIRLNLTRVKILNNGY